MSKKAKAAAGARINPQKNKKKGEEVKKKKKTSTSYKTYNQNYSVQFSLVDAMRFVQLSNIIGLI